MARAGYHSFDVEFEHTGSDSNGTRRIDRRLITVYGDTNSAIEAELKRQERDLANIVVISFEKR